MKELELNSWIDLLLFMTRQNRKVMFR